MTDVLDAVVYPPLASESSGVPLWVSDRGGDCRAHDRRSSRGVYGPNHSFVAATDCLVTNGLIRFSVGPRLLPPYLNVQAFTDGAWREVGCLYLARGAGDVVLIGAPRLLVVTPDVVSLALPMNGGREALVAVCRGERMIRVHHGAVGRSPASARYVIWAGLPPCSRLVSASGTEGGILARSGDEATWGDAFATWGDPEVSWGGELQPPDFWLRWPPSQSNADWSVSLRYSPELNAASQPFSGLLSILDSSDLSAGRLWFDDADQKFKFRLGSTTLESAAQAFTAGAELALTLQLSSETGMALSVGPATGVAVHTYNVATDPGTSEAYANLFLGTSFTGYGDLAYGEGPYGGVELANGVQRELMLFDAPLDELEVELLTDASEPITALPVPESRLVWRAPFASEPIPARSALTDGLAYEATTQEGATRSPDSNGLTKGLGVLSGSAVASAGCGVGQWTDALDVAAFLATTDVGDDLADYHQQFAAASEQIVRVGA